MDHMIGKTDVDEKTLNPKWVTDFAFTRAEAAKYGGEAELRFEVYDHDLIGGSTMRVATLTHSSSSVICVMSVCCID